ncbi:hypothetical protein G647_02568 [Cladophialophora carrionii CBS 160.54]|uniref:Uncharacterized protein n=1 Tax=Cladophialophora carrionii CBS 160.54 TaxID=1279043 RepID=V9DFX6_9EURO|nr:uncharacterized protein G647_02568 [Cladophialophora carrionii CBS 160.54]ETI25794.1 hypothetical protein G647_02568 [Cladophialophora carrionii CBS 160.54]
MSSEREPHQPRPPKAPHPPAESYDYHAGNTSTQYSSVNAFLTAVAHAPVDVGQKTSLEMDQSMLQYAVRNVSSRKVTATRSLLSLALMQKDQIDFSSASPEIQTALDAISEETANVKGDRPILALSVIFLWEQSEGKESDQGNRWSWSSEESAARVKTKHLADVKLLISHSAIFL